MSDLFSFKGVPIIQSGSSTTNSIGANSVVFTTAYSSTPTVMAIARSSGNSAQQLNVIMIHTVSTTGFSVRGVKKDGRNGENGGGWYTGIYYWIAVASTS